MNWQTVFKIDDCILTLLVGILSESHLFKRLQRLKLLLQTKKSYSNDECCLSELVDPVIQLRFPYQILHLIVRHYILLFCVIELRTVFDQLCNEVMIFWIRCVNFKRVLLLFRLLRLAIKIRELKGDLLCLYDRICPFLIQSCYRVLKILRQRAFRVRVIWSSSVRFFQEI